MKDIVTTAEFDFSIIEKFPIKEEMRRDGDNLYTIPLTSTGYVRRDVKQSVKERLPHDWLQPILPDLHLYDMLLEAFRGGNTHAKTYVEQLPSAQPEPPEPEELDFVQPHKKIGVQLEIGR